MNLLETALNEQYKKMGLDEQTIAYGNEVRESLKERFAQIDAMAELNQMKVLQAMLLCQ